MHVEHIIAIEADDYDDAIGSTESFLMGDWENTGQFPWSDWHRVCGRYTGEFGELQNALCYADDTDRFESTVAKMLSARERALDGYLERAKETGITVDNLKERRGTVPYYGGLWALKKAVCIAEGDSGSDAYFYDAEAYTESDEYLQERIKTDPSRQWIVVVDFHF
jgi:hypothetical protein